MTVAESKQTLGFQTEVNQILHLVVHSLYSNKEIFLRELISNAADANDKLRYLTLANSALYENDSNLKIRVEFDEKAKTITITDNGIGMSRDDAIEHLGTIAKSGTKEFIAKLSGDKAKDSLLIGQFGVGFYSAFVVADKVTVYSRKAGLPAEQGVCWESTGEGQYTVSAANLPQRGTKIVLHLKEEGQEFLNGWRLRNIITKYSDHINWPIEMLKEADASDDEKEGEEKAVKPVEFETVNRATALWTLPKSDIKAEEYNELYKHLTHDFSDPLTYTHNHVEGKQHYISLLFIPSRAPFDMWQQESQHGLKLYVKRVFILDDAKQFLPNYLRFVKGVIDSSDLPLNVSREILQENQLVEAIRTANVKRVLGVLEKMAESEPEQYAKFWKEFGLVLKEGPIEDYSNRERIAKLLRFSSTHTDDALPTVSLSDYLARMKEGQDKIYYICGESFSALKNSPHLEIFRKKGIEVLLLQDRIDEWMMNHLSEFEGKHLQSVTKGEVDLGDLEDKEEVEEVKKAEGDFSSLIEHVKKVLGERVKDVRLTHRLTTSPACVVADSHDMGREMQRILQAAGQAVPESKPIFEINPKHALISRLNAETDDHRFSEWTYILLDQAILAEGGQLQDPGQFVHRLNTMLLELAR